MFTFARCRRIGVVLIVLMAMVVGGEGDAHATGYRITGPDGANIRTTPSRSAPVVRVAPDGEAVEVICQIVGDTYGGWPYPDNRTWDGLADGTFVHDHLVTTPGGVTEWVDGGGYAYWTPGLPRCGQGDDGGDVGSLQVEWSERPFRCDGGSRTMGTLVGAASGERIDFSSPDVGGLRSGTADGNGRLRLTWQCDPSESGGTWRVTATGQPSGRSGTFTVTSIGSAPTGGNGPPSVENPSVAGFPITGPFRTASDRLGAAVLGQAVNASHWWGQLEVQDFHGGFYGDAILIKDPVTASASMVRSGFWALYAGSGGPSIFGAPTGEEYAVSSGARQDFRNGTMDWNAGTGAISFSSAIKLKLYGKYRSIIDQSAMRYGIDTRLVAVTIQHEGSMPFGDRTTGPYPGTELLNCVARGGSTGLAQMQPQNLDRMGYGNLSRTDKCKKLANDAGFSIDVAARLLANIQQTFSLTNKDAFVAYAFVSYGEKPGASPGKDVLDATGWKGTVASQRKDRWNALTAPGATG